MWSRADDTPTHAWRGTLHRWKDWMDPKLRVLQVKTTPAGLKRKSLSLHSSVVRRNLFSVFVIILSTPTNERRLASEVMLLEGTASEVVNGSDATNWYDNDTSMAHRLFDVQSSKRREWASSNVHTTAIAGECMTSFHHAAVKWQKWFLWSSTKLSNSNKLFVVFAHKPERWQVVGRCWQFLFPLEAVWETYQREVWTSPSGSVTNTMHYV